jgi:hypothetical protein
MIKISRRKPLRKYVWGKKFKNINEIKKITTCEGNEEHNHGKNCQEVRCKEWDGKLKGKYTST